MPEYERLLEHISGSHLAKHGSFNFTIRGRLLAAPKNGVNMVRHLQPVIEHWEYSFDKMAGSFWEF
jgi:hypothetical protein